MNQRITLLKIGVVSMAFMLSAAFVIKGESRLMISNQLDQAKSEQFKNLSVFYVFASDTPQAPEDFQELKAGSSAATSAKDNIPFTTLYYVIGTRPPVKETLGKKSLTSFDSLDIKTQVAATCITFKASEHNVVLQTHTANTHEDMATFTCPSKNPAKMKRITVSPAVIISPAQTSIPTPPAMPSLTGQKANASSSTSLADQLENQKNALKSVAPTIAPSIPTPPPLPGQKQTDINKPEEAAENQQTSIPPAPPMPGSTSTKTQESILPVPAQPLLGSERAQDLGTNLAQQLEEQRERLQKTQGPQSSFENAKPSAHELQDAKKRLRPTQQQERTRNREFENELQEGKNRLRKTQGPVKREIPSSAPFSPEELLAGKAKLKPAQQQEQQTIPAAPPMPSQEKKKVLDKGPASLPFGPVDLQQGAQNLRKSNTGQQQQTNITSNNTAFDTMTQAQLEQQKEQLTEERIALATELSKKSLAQSALNEKAKSLKSDPALSAQVTELENNARSGQAAIDELDKKINTLDNDLKTIDQILSKKFGVKTAEEENNAEWE